MRNKVKIVLLTTLTVFVASACTEYKIDSESQETTTTMVGRPPAQRWPENGPAAMAPVTTTVPLEQIGPNQHRYDKPYPTTPPEVEPWTPSWHKPDPLTLTEYCHLLFTEDVCGTVGYGDIKDQGGDWYGWFLNLPVGTEIHAPFSGGLTNWVTHYENYGTIPEFSMIDSTDKTANIGMRFEFQGQHNFWPGQDDFMARCPAYQRPGGQSTCEIVPVNVGEIIGIVEDETLRDYGNYNLVIEIHKLIGGEFGALTNVTKDIKFK